jgi:hypothetical protein
MPFIGSIPVTLIKENFYIDIRDSINICSRYDHHRRRGVDSKRRKWNGYPDVYINSGVAFNR